MKKALLILGILGWSITISIAQVSINNDGSIPDSSAMLDIKSNNKGLLVPRMLGAEIINIANPSNGLLVFNKSNDRFFTYISTDSTWLALKYDTITLWSCGDSIVDSRDNQRYATVLVGSQCWMAQSLNVGNMINDSISPSDNGTIEKYCYDNDITYCSTYGGLYNWHEMMDYVEVESAQGICPTGWHVPSDTETMTMEISLGMPPAYAMTTGARGVEEGSEMAGIDSLWADGVLKSNGAFGASGLNAIPGGSWRPTGSIFEGEKYKYYQWTSSGGPDDYLIRFLQSSSPSIFRLYWTPDFGFSVRCVKD